MKNSASVVAWLQIPYSLRTLTGGNWQERCYPFRGVLAEQRANDAIERRRLLDDCRLAFNELEESFECRI